MSEGVELRTAEVSGVGAANNAGTIADRTPRYLEYEVVTADAPVREKTARKTGYFIVKRIMDIILSLFALAVLSPLLLIVAIAVKLESSGPVIFTQTRLGKKAKPFTMYKFRSMCVGADDKLRELQALNERDGPVFKISNDPRVTKVGKLIRATCIDELPQLINVLKGEMSIVGPRPPLPSEVRQYNRHQMQRLEATPGLTCYWQVCDRNKATFDDWVEMDIQYIRECGIIPDIKLICKTFRVIFVKGGAA